MSDARRPVGEDRADGDAPPAGAPSEDAPSEGVPPARPPRYDPGRVALLRWSVLGLALLVGVLVCVAIGGPVSRHAGSFVGGEVLAVAALEFGGFNVRTVMAVNPKLGLPAAMFTYVLTALALLLFLVLSSPDVVSGTAVAIGLATGVVVWTATEVAKVRVR